MFLNLFVPTNMLHYPSWFLFWELKHPPNGLFNVCQEPYQM